MRSIEVHVWWADLRSADVGALAQLPRRERSRIDDLTAPADRGRRLVGALLLQEAIRAVRGLVPGTTVEIDRTCGGCGAQHGRPVAADGLGPHLTVSHSGALVVAAACVEAPVGVDVERVASEVDPAAWVAGEARVKAGLGDSAGTILELTPPLSGYAAALAVATDRPVEVAIHLRPTP